MKILNSLGTKCSLLALCCFFALTAFTSLDNPSEAAIHGIDINKVDLTTMEMPIGFELKSETEKLAFFESLTYEESKALEVNYTVKEYLASIKKLDVVTNSMKNGTKYSELNLSTYLNKSELKGLKSFKTIVSSAACSYQIYCGPSGWCSTPYFHIRRNCNGSYYGFCTSSCSYF